jgi:hypothetical protein
MTRSVSSTIHRPDGSASLLGRAVLATYLATIAAACALAFVYGSLIHVADEAEKTRAIDEENRGFCGRFGAGPGTTRFAECADALKDVRIRHLQRNTRDLIF